jgi:hypothetical protein
MRGSERGGRRSRRTPGPLPRTPAPIVAPLSIDGMGGSGRSYHRGRPWHPNRTGGPVNAGSSIPSLRSLAGEGIGAVLTLVRATRIIIAFALLGVFPLLVRFVLRRLRPSASTATGTWRTGDRPFGPHEDQRSAPAGDSRGLALGRAQSSLGAPCASDVLDQSGAERALQHARDRGWPCRSRHRSRSGGAWREGRARREAPPRGRLPERRLCAIQGADRGGQGCCGSAGWRAVWRSDDERGPGRLRSGHGAPSSSPGRPERARFRGSFLTLGDRCVHRRRSVRRP